MGIWFWMQIEVRTSSYIKYGTAGSRSFQATAHQCVRKWWFWYINPQVVDAGVSGATQCVRNPCPKPNMVRLDNCRVVKNTGSDGTCYSLDSTGPCEDQTTLRIDTTISEPLCITTHSIFSTIGPRCSRGSIRDNRGRCRTNFARLLRELPPIVTSKPSTHGNGTCPTGQVFMAGICIRLALSWKDDTQHQFMGSTRSDFFVLGNIRFFVHKMHCFSSQSAFPTALLLLKPRILDKENIISSL